MITITTTRRKFLSAAFYLLPLAFCLFFAGCQRAPQTAAELQRNLPHQFKGDVLVQGSTEPHHLIVEPHEVSVRNEHLLEFNKVRYQILAGSEVLTEGDAGIRGTISVPDLEIRVESATDNESSDAMKPDTFKGQLSADLRTATAEWSSGMGQKVTLKVTAVGP